MTPAEQRMRLLPCAYCRSIKGEACVTKTGRRRPSSHAWRFYAAKREGLLPVRPQ